MADDAETLDELREKLAAAEARAQEAEEKRRGWQAENDSLKRQLAAQAAEAAGAAEARAALAQQERRESLLAQFPKADPSVMDGLRFEEEMVVALSKSHDQAKAEEEAAYEEGHQAAAHAVDAIERSKGEAQTFPYYEREIDREPPGMTPEKFAILPFNEKQKIPTSELIRMTEAGS